MQDALGTAAQAGTTRHKRALGKRANRDSRTQARLRLVKDLNLVLLAIIILAWETSSVSRVSEARYQNLTLCGPGKSPFSSFLPPCKSSTGAGEGGLDEGLNSYPMASLRTRATQALQRPWK